MKFRRVVLGYCKLALGLSLLVSSALAHAGSGPTTLSNPNPSFSRYYFGSDVALTPDGSIAVVAANAGGYGLDAPPAVYIFQYANSAWSATPIIVCDPSANAACSSDSAPVDLFASAVSVSSINNNSFQLIVGSPGGGVVNGSPVTYGVVYVYQCTLSPTVACGAPVATITDPGLAPFGADDFGTAVAISQDGNTVLVGAWGTPEPGGTGVTGNQPDEGDAYVYNTTGGNNWTLTATLLNPAPTCGSFGRPPPQIVCDEFGYAVALSGTGGNQIALIGAPGAAESNTGTLEPGEGQAFIFGDNSGSWSSEAAFTDPNTVACNDVAYLTCDEFGFAVALSADATKALVGAPNAVAPLAVGGEEGAVNLYMQASSSWQGVTTPVATFTNPQIPGDFPPPAPFNSIYTGVGGFGSSLALSADGTTMIVGLPEALEGFNTFNYGGTGQAAVYTCSYSSNPVMCSPYETLVDPPALQAPFPSPTDFFGAAVAISGDANVMLASAPDTDSTSNGGTPDNGTAYVYGEPIVAPPIANPGTLLTGENNPASGTLTSSNPGSSPTYAIVNQPTHGALSNFNSTAGTFTYTPAIGFSGSDSFTFDVSNGSVTSTPATITITVTAAEVSLSYVGPGSSSNNASVNSFIPNSHPPTPQQYVYTATVTNVGSVTADNLSLIVNVPTGITVLGDSSNNGGICPQKPTNGTVTCTLPSLSTRASWVVTVTVTFNSVSINTSLTDSARLTLSNSNFFPHVSDYVVVQATTGSSSGGSSGGGSLGWLELLLLASLLWLMRRTRKPPRTMPPSQPGARGQLHPFSALAVVVTVAIPTLAGCALNLKPSPADGSMGLSPSPVNLTVDVTSNTEFVNTGKNGTPTTIPATLDGAAVTLTCSSPSICSLSQGFAVGAHTFAVTALVTWPAFYSAPTNAPVACNVPGNGTTLNQCYSLTTSATFAVGCAQGALTATNTTLIPVPAGKSASYQLEAQGGCPPYTWTVGNPGGLPPGISISPMGLVAGTETTACTQDPWTFDNTIKVTDSLGDTGQASMTFNIC